MLKILHMADLHLDDQHIEDATNCMSFIEGYALETAPDLIVIAGDMFNSRMVRLDSKATKAAFEFIRSLAGVAPVTVLIGTPSHDGMAAEAMRHIKGEYPVYVSGRPEQMYLTNNRFTINPDPIRYPDAVLSFIPTPTKQFFKTESDISGANDEIAEAMTGMFQGFAASAAEYRKAPHIMIGHFSVGGAFISDTQQLIGVDIELSRSQIDMAEADLVCLGHIHKRQAIGENIFYSGSIYRTDFGERNEEKGFYLHKINKRNNNHMDVTSTFVETPARKLIKIEADLRKGENAPAAEDNIDIIGSFVRIELTVWQDEAVLADIAWWGERFAAAKDVEIRIIRVPRETVRSTRILKLSTLREKLVELAATKNEDVPESILTKADILENGDSTEPLSLGKALPNAV